MKRVWAAVLASACGRVDFAPVPDGAPGDAPVDDLLLHYEFDTLDPRVDSAQVAHPGACIACPSIAAGRVGAGAALFDSSQCLEVPGSRALQPSTFSFAAWARPRVPHHGTAFGRSRVGGATDDNTFELWFEVDPTWNVATHDRRVIRSAQLGVWHHYAATYDGTDLVAYFDGSTVDSVLASPLAYTPDDVAIGCDLNFGAFVQRFDGTVDDVRLYGRALTSAEVAALAAM